MTLGPEPRDAVLAGRAAKGDERAFAQLVRRHQDPVYRLLRRYLGDDDEAYEAAHEAFIAAWRALARYDPRRPFGAWLRTIAINKARDRGRRLAVRRRLFVAGLPEQAQAADDADPNPAPDDRPGRDDALDALDKAIAGLPPGLKAPLILTVFDGLSHRAAGLVLGISPKAVEVRVYRARRALDLALGPERDR